MLDVPYVADLIQVTLRGSPFPHTQRAIPLLLGTAAQESGFEYTQQIGGGPALGYWQLEGPTEVSIWADYLEYHGDLADWFLTRCGRDGPDTAALEHDMVYGLLLARTLYYWRDPDPLPAAEDIEEAAVRYKKYYNTIYGSATEQEYIESYRRLVQPYYPSGRQR